MVTKERTGVCRMRIFALTGLGKRTLRDGTAEPEELKVLEHLEKVKTSADTELECVGERWLINRLKERGKIKELTT